MHTAAARRAAALSFATATGETMLFESPLPADLQAVIDSLGMPDDDDDLAPSWTQWPQLSPIGS